MSKKAFTMAEVLITLGIIGLVAAITLPSVINKVQKFVLKQQFKKTINIVNQAILKTYADFGYVPACYYFNGQVCVKTECLIFHKELIKNLKTIKYCRKTFSDGCLKDIHSAGGIFTEEIIGKGMSYVLGDGSVLWMRDDGSTGSIYLFDVNGVKKPNKWGYDVFALILTDKKLNCYAEYVEDGGTKCSDILKNK